jgi:hypothetical protein
MDVYLDGGPQDGQICSLQRQVFDSGRFEIMSFSYYDSTRRRGNYIKKKGRVDGRPVFKFGGWSDPEWDD